MLVGYIWVASTDDHALHDQQQQALLGAGVTATQIYEDIGISRQQERPEWQHCLDALQAEDTLVVWQLDRMVTSRAHLLQVLQDFWQRNIGLKVLTGQGAEIDTTHISLRTVLDVLEALTELENQIVREATLEGLAAARARGQTLGARRKMTATMVRQAMLEMTDTNTSATQIAKKLGITRATLYNYLNGDGSPKPAALKLLQTQEEE
ncbi:MAG: recombinase family protein [Leptolyngbya sp. SIO1D8]|nr:recombinase family protein [Leptolyngbya sp. SIO1D8]